jgi:hypothetical protein
VTDALPPPSTIQACVLVAPSGILVAEVKPQYHLNDLQAAASNWASNAEVPRGYATDACMKQLYKEGYTVVWFSLPFYIDGHGIKQP